MLQKTLNDRYYEIFGPESRHDFQEGVRRAWDLVISFLNALLPFESEEEKIKSVEYLNPELVPLNPLKKDSIVDVRCRDSLGRQFIVEMQISSSRKEGFRRGHKEGLEEGRKEGMKEERIKNARGMKAEGFADVIIARITGLAPEEIAALK